MTWSPINREGVAAIAGQYDVAQTESIERYLIFLGHAHSGHSLVGALIDAHPDAAIANEMSLFRLLDKFSLSRREICALTLHHVPLNRYDRGWFNTGYSYRFGFGQQGETRGVRLVGDKKGGVSTRWIRRRPELFDRLETEFGSDLRMLCVVRNPFDNLAAYAFRTGRAVNGDLITFYFDQLRCALSVRDRLGPERAMLVHHESLIEDPRTTLRGIFEFLALGADDEVLSGALDVVRDRPHRRRETLNWSRSCVDAVTRAMRDETFAPVLQRYLD